MNFRLDMLSKKQIWINLDLQKHQEDNLLVTKHK